MESLSAVLGRAPRRAFCLLATVAFVTGLMVANAPFSGAATSHAPVAMPDVVGKTRAQVFAIMAADQLFFTTHGTGSNNGTWVRVLAQDPTPGTLVPYRSTVSLTVTAGVVHQPLPAPDLVGLTRAQVYRIMKSYQLFFTTNGPGASNGTWKSVVSQTPFADTLVKWHSMMHLTVSLAVPHPKRAVPRVVGDSRAAAVTALNGAQLYFHAQGPGSANGTWTKVLAVSPGAGTQVPWHSTVILQVTGPSATSTTTTAPPTTTTTTSSTTTTFPGETTTTTTPPPTTTTTAPPTTTTTVKKPTTTTTVKKPSKANDYREGIATWYSYIPGQCATWYLPLGTRVVVRDLATGHAIVCLVTDHEAAKGDHVVDLSETQFAELEPLWRGVIRVKVSW
jgi:beta-lactam-binding protein with PASTA domain